jgi:hypothetical protein
MSIIEIIIGFAMGTYSITFSHHMQSSRNCGSRCGNIHNNIGINQQSFVGLYKEESRLIVFC